MNNETFNHDHQEAAEPTDYDRLGEEVEFAGRQAEQPKQFRDLSPEEIPDGVRDERDYQEYQAEQSAREQERANQEQERIDRNLHLFSINFLNDNYRAHNKNLQEGGEFAERYQDLLDSPDLVILAENDITIGGLYGAGLLRRSGDGTLDDIFGENGVTETVTNIAMLWTRKNESGEPWYSDDERAEFMNIYNKLKNRQKLNSDDYSFVDSVLMPQLSDLIDFGLPDKRGDEQTLNYIQEGSSDFIFSIYNNAPIYIMKKIDDGSIANERGIISDALGELCRNNLDNIYGRMGLITAAGPSGEFDNLKELLLRSFSSTDIKFEHGHLAEVGISDKEMLESVFCFKKVFGDVVSFAPWEESLRDLAGQQESLENSGFSRDSIINVLHDNEAEFGGREIANMREAGVSDADIIYAGKFYENYHPEIGDIRDKEAWDNRSAFEANFSERDMILAIQREIYYQEKQNQSR
ncbi:hypothetical protein IKF03_01660 [Candidatus Saccharibacteria bacterium]|nr:hypothetical protein [Candidatus Saccharibacteria bacterium]